VRKGFQSINSRILLLPVLSVIALFVAGGLSIISIGDITHEEHQARARAVTDAAVKIVEMFESKAATGEMSEQAAQAAAKAVLRPRQASNITEVQHGSSETGSASSQVLSAAQSLSAESNRLKTEVQKFLSDVRAA
jgi:hypothetical protein